MRRPSSDPVLASRKGQGHNPYTVLRQSPPGDEPLEDELLERVRRAARGLYDHEEAARAEREHRDAAIVAALDAERTPEQVAAAAALGRTQVFRILAASDA